jgi:hypothetical protein
LIENPEIAEEIKQQVLATGGYAAPVSEDGAEAAEEPEDEEALHNS